MEDLERALRPIQEQLKKQEAKLDEIGKTLQAVAIQSARLDDHDRKIEDLYSKWNRLLDPETGVIRQMQNHQASCPRAQVRAMWAVLIPLVLMLLSVAGLVMKNI